MILFLHGNAIGLQNAFSSGKCGNEHYERAFGQMKIGDQAVNGLEFVAGINKNLGIGAPGMQNAVFIRRAFERPAGGRSDCNDAAAGFFR